MASEIKKFHLNTVTTLVIDDDQITRNLVNRLLGVMGATTTLEATDGLEGLRLAFGEQRPQLIICDLNMKPVDGMVVLGAIRSSMNPEIASIPMVIFSGLENQNVGRHVLSKGANGYIPKPFNPIELSEYLSNLLQISNANEKVS